MGYSYNFENNALYGVDDVNNIVANFTSAGVSTYSDLNGITGALASAGVTNASESCEVIITSNGKLKIKPGVAFFEDGSAITIDFEGVELDAHKYVYFKKDSITKKGYPVSSDTAPGTSDIPLAEYENESLTDVRPRAVSRIEGFGTNVIYKKPETMEEISNNEYFILTDIPINAPASGTNTYRVGSISLPEPTRFTHVIVTDPYNTMIASGKIATSIEANDADYSYGYYTRTDGYTIIENGGQKSFMIFGRKDRGKIYASFLPVATGFDLYFTVETAPPIKTLDISWNIMFF